MMLARAVKRSAEVAGALVVAGGLAGCGGGLGGVAPDHAGSDPLASLLAFNTVHPPPAAPVARQEEDFFCPQVEVLDGTASLRTFAGGQGNENVRYQFSLGNVERECRHDGDRIEIKVGVEGRVLIGPAGAPGSFAAPVRIAIRRESDHKPQTSTLYRVPVTIPSGSTEAPFTLVTDPIVVPFLHAKADEDYTVVVGFDQAGGTVQKVAVRRRRR